MAAGRVIKTTEQSVLLLFFVWVIWLPLPFGSIVPAASVPLIVPPLALCAAAALIRLAASRRSHDSRPAIAGLVWAAGALLFVALCAVQLVPLPVSVQRIVSPESYTIWSEASRVASLTGIAVRDAHPISVDPSATALETFRLAALLATFVCALLLIRTHERRIALAAVLCATAMFESLYGLREAALQRYEIWGWVNRLNFNRVTGTFVNPNHFAHYLAIVVPMTVFLAAVAWHLSGSRHTPLQQRVASLIERHLFAISFAAMAALCCVAGMLLSQSRGALLALAAGLAAVAAMLPGRRVARVALGSLAAAIVVLCLVLFLGPDRTVERFMPTATERQTFVGRRTGIAAAVDLWKRFAVAGSGAGTFERVVSSGQRDDLAKLYHHAHNDYAEIAATTGTAGFVIAAGSLLWGYILLVRMTFGPASDELSWRRRAFQAAALGSISIAMVHALFDFNFFMPSNPATLAAIAGAAVAGVHHDRRNRRPAPLRV